MNFSVYEPSKQARLEVRGSQDEMQTVTPERHSMADI